MRIRSKNSGLILALAFALSFIAAYVVNAAQAEQIRLNASMAQKSMMLNGDRTAYLHIDLEGLPLPDSRERAPVNVALVIDRSGSMSGEKLRQAKRAAIMALGLLDSRDTISIVTYSNGVDVLVPATPLRDREMIERRIEKVFAGGSTALYAGVKAGGEQLEDYLDKERVNRLILLSDGLANVGPQSPEELGELGYRLIRKGISVTTLGLGMGYNEDLMTRLANVTDGNHAFVETADDLEKFFALEFGDITSVVGQDIIIEIHVYPGFRPKRTLWRKSQIKGNVVRAHLNQVYGAQKKDMTLEVEIPRGKQTGPLEVAEVTIRYKDMLAKKQVVLKDRVKLILTRSAQEAEASIDKKVMSRVVALQAIEKNRRALKLRDKGRIKAARRLYRSNAAILKRAARKYNAPALSRQAKQADSYSNNLERRKWRKMRKMQKHQQRSTGAFSKY